MNLEELLKLAAEPHLITSAAKANEYLARLQAFISDLRLEVSELELKSDLELNSIFKTGISEQKGRAEWKVSLIYREWQTKKGLLSDVRAVRRNLERHADLLMNQEKYSSKYQNKSYLG